MLGYYLQAYIIRQTDSKASSTVCSLLISDAQSTWHLRGSVRKPSSLHTLGMTIASSHTSSFMADDLRLQFSSVFRARPAAASCEWKLNETREKHFTIFIFCCTSLSLKPPLVENLIWARLRAFRNCSAGTGLSVAESRLVDWSNSWPAMRRENSCSSCRYHFVIDHLVGFLVSCFRWGIKASTANKIYSYPPHVDTRRRRLFWLRHHRTSNWFCVCFWNQ